jgi:hypothetical protein
MRAKVITQRVKKSSQILLCICLIISCISVFGQEKSDISDYQTKVIKYGLAGLAGDWITNSMGIQFGFEMELDKNKSFEQDLMYIFGVDDNGSNMYIYVDNIYGFKTNSELRFYLDKEPAFPLNGFYLAPAFVFQYTRAKRSQTLDSYQKNNYDVIRYFTALNMKFGFQTPIWKNFLFDLSVGGGIQYIHSRTINKEPDSVSEKFYFNTEYDSGNGWIIGPALSINLGYRF